MALLPEIPEISKKNLRKRASRLLTKKFPPTSGVFLEKKNCSGDSIAYNFESAA
jgi:hypothetical protein